jgi:hypothetical protein
MHQRELASIHDNLSCVKADFLMLRSDTFLVPAPISICQDKMKD